MSTALEDVATAADEVADDQRRVARRARAMQRQRDRGWSWAKILDREAEPGLLGLLRSSGRRLAESVALLAQALARGLTGEGESRRQIARRLGVTHQRISAMLGHDRRGVARQDTPGGR
jgi:CRP-like cAMP-binding protein